MSAGNSAVSSTDDAALLAALRAGDEAAFTRIVTEWSPAMLRLARYHVATDASAEEIVQDAWLGALRGLTRFEGRSRLRTWVLRIVVNIAITRGQQERRIRPFSDIADAIQPGPAVDPARFRPPGEHHAGGWWSFPAQWPPVPEGQVLSAELLAMLREAVARLPRTQRIVLALRDIDGYEAAEVCDILGISAGNQRVLLHRARTGVRAALADYFAAPVPAAAGEVTR